MAFITERDLQQSTGADAVGAATALPAFAPKTTTGVPKKTEEPGALDVWASAFRTNNMVTGVYDRVTNPYSGSQEFDRNFSPRRKALQEGLGAYADEFTNVGNPEQYEHVKQSVLAAKRAREIVDNAGGLGTGASVAAALVDPVGMLLLAVPGVGEARVAQLATQGARVAARAGTYGAAGVGFGVVQGAALDTVRPTTDAESTKNMYSLGGTGTNTAIAAGIGMALFGAAGRAASKATKSAVGKAIDRLLVDTNGALLPETATAAQKAAGTVVNDASSKLYQNAGTKAVLGTTPDLVQGTGMKLALSPFNAMREWGQKIAPDIMQRLGTKDGIESPVNAKLLSMLESGADIHGFGRTLIDTKKSLDSLKNLTPAEQAEILQQFQLLGLGAKSIDDITPAAVQAHVHELVGHAVATGKTHIIPEIETAAQKLRDVFNKDWTRINAQGMVGKVGAAAAQAAAPVYFTRVFNKTGIAAQQMNFIRDIAPHIEQSLIAAGHAVADAAQDAEKIAIAATNKIIGMGAGTGADVLAAMNASGPMGKLAARTLDIPHDVLAPYLEHDAYKVLNTYKRSVEPQLALKEVFGHTSFADFQQVVMMPERDRVKKALIDSAKTATGDDLARINSELNGFDAAWKDGEKQLEALFGGMLGHTRMAENAHTALATGGRLTRSAVSMAMLSGQVVSSLVDIPRQVMSHGLTPVMGAWGNYLTSSTFRAMGRETAERVGVALELTGFKLKTHGDQAFSGFEREVIGHVQGPIERGADRLSERFQWLNGAMLWNDSMRTVTSLLGEDRLLRAAEKGWANLNKSDREWMLVLGVGEQGLNGIRAASQGSTQTTRRFMHTDLENWVDMDAARTFKLAILKDASTTSMTPFQGTLPGWYDSEVGKFLWQFKSFISASYQQTLMVGLQRNDARTWMGVVTAIGTGMAISSIKETFAASPSKEKSMTERVLEGIDRSGIADMPLALAGYVNAGVASLTGKSFAPFADNNRRPAGVLDAALGPTGSVLKKIGQTSERVYEQGGSVDEKAQQGIASVTPYHKILGVDVARAVIESIHGHTTYIDKVTQSIKDLVPGSEE